MGAFQPTRAAILAALVFSWAVASADDAAPCPGFSGALTEVTDSLVLVRAGLAQAGAADQTAFTNTGFFVGTQGEVITSLFGLAGCRDISVVCTDGRTASAQVAAVDQACGLALLKTELTETSPLRVRTDPPAPGSWMLLASARPGGDRAAVTLQPMLLQVRTSPVLLRGIQWQGLISGSAPVADGTGAAPLVDAEGLLLGAVLGVLRHDTEPGAPAECLALPVDRVMLVIERLKGGESRRLGWLGVAILREPSDLEGVRVAAVLENSPAHAAGIKPNDILLQVGDDAIDSTAMFMRCVAESQPGTVMSLRVLHGSRIDTIPVRVSPRPLLIYGGPRRSGGRDVPARSNQAGLLTVQERMLLQELSDENRRLRERVQRLEERLSRLEQ